MKMNKAIKLLVLGVSLTFAVAGCKTKHPDVTKLPDRPGMTGSKDRNLDNSGKVDTGDVAKTELGGGPTADFNPDDFNQDRAALAAQTVHFDFDSSVVKAAEKSNVEAVAAALKSDSVAKLLIEGHCDERGTEEYNRSLGERRALALRETLATLGVDPMRVKTISYGEDKPVDPGHDESAWRKNRRGEFILLHPK
jgi:peptidoglycan-associated lipoprotein